MEGFLSGINPAIQIHERSIFILYVHLPDWRFPTLPVSFPKLENDLGISSFYVLDPGSHHAAQRDAAGKAGIGNSIMSPQFTSPFNLHAFNAMVWEIALQIPPGKVATYGQIAGLIQPPGGMAPKSYMAFGPRWVGGAMANCPPDVPWQRVINAQGKISLRPGAEQQRQLLESEGVDFDDRGRLDLKKFRWDGPDENWCRERGLSQPPSKTQQGS